MPTKTKSTAEAEEAKGTTAVKTGRSKKTAEPAAPSARSKKKITEVKTEGLAAGSTRKTKSLRRAELGFIFIINDSSK